MLPLRAHGFSTCAGEPALENKLVEPVQIQAGVWSEAILIRSYDVDFTQCATLESLCRCFLDAAWRHAEILGVGYRALAATGKLWVLSRLLVQVERYPRWDESVELTTWPAATRLALAMRHFAISDRAGGSLALGVSAWLVLDAGTRRPQRLEKLLGGIVPLADKRALAADPRKLPVRTALTGIGARAVQYSDLDANRHLNSARCLSWLLDTQSLEFHRGHEAARVEVNYLGEALAGESLYLSSAQAASGEHSFVIRRATGDEVCRASIQWRARMAEQVR